jgi:hypothetical protein
MTSVTPHPQPARRGLKIASRWAQVLSVGAAGAAFWILANFFLGETTSLLGELGGVTACGALLLGLLKLLLPDRRRLTASLGLRHFGTFPPLWFGVLFGVTLLLSFVFLTASAMPLLGLGHSDMVNLRSMLAGLRRPILIGTGVLYLAPLVAWKIIRGTTKKTTQTTPATTTSGPFERQQEWLVDDSELSRVEQDRFGRHGAVAARLVDRIRVADTRGVDTAIVGALGSGKTTIRRFVEDILRREGLLGTRVELVSVSLWPFETETAAVRSILQALVTALGAHVSTLGVIGVPARYISLVGEPGGLWGILTRIMSRDQEPKDALAALNTIADGLDLNVVLWLEDLERFAGADLIVESTQPKRERLRLVRSLLHMIEGLTRFSVVMATTSLDNRFDTEKIVRHVERVPLLLPEDVWNEVACFRTGAFQTRSDLLMDAASKKAREPLANLDDEVRQGTLRTTLTDGGALEPAQALALLAQTPRQLKQCLRSCKEAWMRVRGEIDFDDLLLMCVIRESCPDVFALVDRYIDEIRPGLPAAVLRSSKRKSRFQRELHRRTKLLPRGQAAAIEAVLHFVFPGYDDEPKDVSDKPQGLASTLHIDTWRLFVSSERPTTSAQAVMSTMRLFEEKKNDDLMALLDNGETASAVEAYSRLLSDDSLILLLEKVAARASHQHWQAWGDDEARSLLAIWRMLLDRRRDPQKLVELIVRLVGETAPNNLNVAYTLAHYFGSQEASAGSLMTADQAQRANQALVDAIAALSTPDAVIKALRGAHPRTILKCTWQGRRTVAPTDTRKPFAGWEGFAKALLDASDQQPTLVLPHLILLLVVEKTRTRYDLIADDEIFERYFVFDEVTAGKLFDYDRLRHLVLANPAGEWVPTDFLAMYEAIEKGFRPATA